MDVSNISRRNDPLVSSGCSFGMFNLQSAQNQGGAVQFDQVIPNFVCKHVRSFCDDFAKHSKNLRTKEKEEEVSMTPSAIEAFAAVVMVDVSGYSKLSSTLAELGPMGAEILGKTMKGYLDKIIHIILLHGGDIVKFAGDAVVFYWKMETSNQLYLDDNRRGELVLKASHCCLDLLTKLGTFDINIPDCDTKVLRIHLGIGAGKIYDVHVGDLGRWEHFIAGDAVNQLAHVLDLAKAGELAMSHQALKWFSTIMDIGTVTIGSYDKRCIILSGLEHARRKIPPPTPTDTDDLALWEIQLGTLYNEYYKCFVARSALFKLQADINQSRLFQLESSLTELMSLTELRQVTTMFIRIGSLLNWEGPDMIELAQAAMKTVQKALHKYEGSLRQFHVDDKGASILAFFGLPPLAHENDAIYCIKSALEIKETFENIFEEFSIGLTTGVVSIGGVGNAIRTEYAVMGDSINMAARLMFQPHARRSILCDEASYNLTEREFMYEKLGEVKVKGKARPIAIFRPKSVIPENSKPNRAKLDGNELTIIGRVQERDEIVTALKDLSNRLEDPKIIITQAEGGQGLSTLAKFTQIEAQKNGCFSCMGSAVEMERSTPYYIFRDIVCDLFAMIDEGKVENDLLVLKPNIPIPSPLGETEQKCSLTSVDNQNKVQQLESLESLTENKQQLFQSKNKKELTQESVPVQSRRSITSRSQNTSIPRSLSKTFRPILKTSTDKTQASVLVSPPLLTHSSSNETTSLISVPENKMPGIYSVKARSIENAATAPPQENSATTADIGFGKLRENYFNALSGKDSQKNSVTNELEEKIKHVMEKAKEGSHLTPLLNLVMPFDFNETESVALLHGKIRMKELTELIRRIINFVSSNNPLVLMLHETQWMDALSWELLWDIVHYCPKTMICIFSRPARYYESEDIRNYLMRLKKTPNAISLIVEGLNPAETQQLIIQTWGSTSIKNVSDQIVDNIYKRTAGNPLFVRSLVVALKESGKWRISETGELRRENENEDFDFDHVVLGNDLHSIIVAQFDRLDRYFQLFLKVASVLGQRFLLDDVLYFLSDMTGLMDRFDRRNNAALLKAIENFDKYGYLQRLDGDPEGLFFHFKSAVVRKGIYSMMVKSQRQHLHLSIAMYYEKVMNESNKHRLLIPLYEHYIETDDRHNRKKLTYLEAVSHLYFEKHSMVDAIKHYTLLLNTVELLTNVHGVKIYKPSQMSLWYRELGEAYFSRDEYPEAERHLLFSLKLAGHPFPSSGFQLGIQVKKEQSQRAKYSVGGHGDSFKNLKREHTDGVISSSAVHSTRPSANGDRSMGTDLEYSKTWAGAKSTFAVNIMSSQVQFTQIGYSTNNSSRSSQAPASEDGKEFKEILNIVRLILLTLSQLYLIQGKSKHHKYAVMRGLNLSEKFPKDAIYTKFLAFAGSAFWTMEKRKSAALRYLDAAENCDLRSDPNTACVVTSCQALTLFLMGMWESAYSKYELLSNWASITGDFSIFQEALKMKSHLEFHKFSHPQSLSLARALYVSAVQEDHFHGKLSGILLIIQNLLSIGDKSQIQEIGVTLQNLLSSEQAAQNMNPCSQIDALSSLAAVEIRLGATISIIELIQKIEELTTQIKFQSWKSRSGILILGNILFAEYESNRLPSDRASRKIIVRFCLKIIEFLKKMDVCCLCKAIRYKFKAVLALIKSNSKTEALRQLKKGLLVPEIAEMVYIRARFCLLVAMYSNERSLERPFYLKEAQKLFGQLGAKHDLDIVTKLLMGYEVT